MPTPLIEGPPPPLTCSCKVRRCSTCSQCRRCGCEHDGVPLSLKLNRRRGQHGPHKHKRQTRNGGTVDRSHANTTLNGRPRRSAALGKTYEESEEEPEPEVWKLPSYQNILRYFGEEERAIQTLVCHTGRKSVRQSADYWKPSQDDVKYDDAKPTIFKIYKKILSRVAESVCGPEAAEASLAAFTRKMIPKEQQIASSVKNASTIFHPLATVLTAAKRNSLERRTARAMLCGLFTRSELMSMADQVPGFTLSNNGFSRGRQEFQKLMSEGALPTEARVLERLDQSVLDGVIKSILSCDNVVYRFGDTKRIVLDGKYHDVPAIMKRKSISEMWDHYYSENRDSASVSRTTFHRICNVITHGESTTQRTGVTGLLVDDNFVTLKRIISDFVSDGSEELLQSLESLRVWLDYGDFADAPLTTGSERVVCPRHDPAFGLATRDVSSVKEACCGSCEGMYALLNQIDKLVKRNGADAKTMSVVRDCFQKIELYMGHRLRVVNQQRALSKILENLRSLAFQGEGLDEAVVTIDFRMNAEPVCFRDNRAEFSGNSGLQWHGAMIHFWTAEPEAAESTEKASEQKLYYNYISNADGGQMEFAVAALIEAVLIDIKRDLPHIKRIVVHSENMLIYQNPFVAALLPMLGFSNGVEVTRLIHTETEAGTSLLDAQFARVATKINAWVRQGHDCTAPSHLVAALIADGGIPDTTTEIIEHDRGSLQLLSDQIKNLEKTFATLAGKVNDICYEYDHSRAESNRETNRLAFNLSSCPNIWVRAFKYSEVGLGKLLEIDTMVGVCTLQASEDDDLAGPIALNEDDDNEIRESAWMQATDDSDDAESDDTELDLSSEIVLPRCAVGLVTGVRVISETQIRQRTKTLLCVSDAVANLPASREPKRKNDKDTATYAKQYLLTNKNANSNDIVNVSKLSKEMVTLKYRFASEHVNLHPRLHQGWAQRLPSEKVCGVSYVPRHLEDMKSLLKRGGADRQDKMGPKRIVEVLRSWSTKRYDIPGENEVRAAISQLRVEQRKRGVPCDESFKPRKKQRMEQKYTDYLQKLVVSVPNIGRKEAVSLFRKTYPEATELYSDARLKSKVSILRGMLPKTTSSQTVANGHSISDEHCVEEI